MDFYEIEGKQVFRKYGIPVENCTLVTPETDLDALTYPCVVKAQVLSGKRGKNGGIQFPKNAEECRKAIADIRALKIRGKSVHGIVISEMLKIKEEYYMGATLDTLNKRVVLLFTVYGGMDIEQLAKDSPEKLIRINCTKGLDSAAFRQALKAFDLPAEREEVVCGIAEKLVAAYFDLDATTLEINPLAVLEDGRLVAADAKLSIDDNALYRQEDLVLIPRCDGDTGKSETEKEAEEAGLTYVELNEDGNIGLIAGGAGIGMATVDTIVHYGGKPFNFLDLGGGVTAEKTCAALKILAKNPKIAAILVNIFGGINNCAVMAEGIERAVRETGCRKRIVVKSRGFSQEEGWAIYDRLGLPQIRYGTTDDAVQLLLGEEGKDERTGK